MRHHDLCLTEQATVFRKRMSTLRKKNKTLRAAILKFLDFTAQLKTQVKILPGEIDDFEDLARSLVTSQAQKESE